MANPFEKRATEYLRDDEAFLAVVAPGDVMAGLRQAARHGFGRFEVQAFDLTQD